MNYRHLAIFGNGEFAKVLQFHCGPPYHPLTVHREFNHNADLDFETLDPEKYELMIAVGYKVRKKIYDEAIARGFTVRGWCQFHLNGIEFGRGVIIFPNNNIDPFVKIGSNVVVWGKNHLGHSCSIGGHSFITSGVTIGGGAKIGDECFIGMGAVIRDGITIGDKCIIGAGSVIMDDCESGGVYAPQKTPRSNIPSHRVKI